MNQHGKHETYRQVSWMVVLVVLLWSGQMFTSCSEKIPLVGLELGTQQVREGREVALGACPSYFLRDESGAIINPVTGENADKPYSPKETCGQCHDYDLITRGYHFTHGKGEELPEDHKERYAWVTSPGQYGGRW